MEKRLTLMTVIASVALLGGALTISGISEFNTTEYSPFSTTQSVPIMGHVTLTVYGPDGNVKQYIQNDNLVVNRGENCIGELIFGGTFGCTNAGAIFNDLAIGTSDAPPDGDDTTLAVQTDTLTDASVTANAASGSNPASDAARWFCPHRSALSDRLIRLHLFRKKRLPAPGRCQSCGKHFRI